MCPVTSYLFFSPSHWPKLAVENEPHAFDLQAFCMGSIWKVLFRLIFNYINKTHAMQQIGTAAHPALVLLSFFLETLPGRAHHTKGGNDKKRYSMPSAGRMPSV